MRARWVAKEYKTHARPELFASTPPLKALKVVLSEIATGGRGGKVVALVDVRRAYIIRSITKKRVFVELPPEDDQAGDERMCGLLEYSLYGTRDAAQNWEDEHASTLGDLKLTRGIECPCCGKGPSRANISWQPCKGTTSRSMEERSVVEWGRDGITIEADQRHLRGRYGRILSWNERPTLRLHAPWKGRMKATQGVVESARENNRCGQGQTQTKHEWDGMSDGDDRDRPQLAGDDANDSQPRTVGDITKYRALVAHESDTCHKTNQISNSCQCRCVVRWQNRQCVTRNGSRGLEGISLGKLQEQQACSAGSRGVSRRRTETPRLDVLTELLDGSVSAGVIKRGEHLLEGVDLKRTRTADWRGDKVIWRSVSDGVIMRGGHCMKVDQEAASGVVVRMLRVHYTWQSRIRRLAKDLGTGCKLNLHLNVSTTLCLVNRRVSGQGETRERATPVDTRGVQVSVKFVTKFVGTHVKPADLTTKPLLEAQNWSSS